MRSYTVNSVASIHAFILYAYLKNYALTSHFVLTQLIYGINPTVEWRVAIHLLMINAAIQFIACIHVSGQIFRIWLANYLLMSHYNMLFLVQTHAITRIKLIKIHACQAIHVHVNVNLLIEKYTVLHYISNPTKRRRICSRLDFENLKWHLIHSHH